MRYLLTLKHSKPDMPKSTEPDTEEALAPTAHRRGLASAFVDGIQRSGRYGFALAEIDAVSTSKIAIRAALRRLEARGRVRRLTPHGDYLVIVPHEHATMGAPPAVWFLDDYMHHRGMDYYVGLLSAAEWYGAAHFAVQETQVVASRQLASIDIGRDRLRFLVKRGVARTPVRRLSSGPAFVNVSTPEATMLDLIRYVNAAGGLNRAAAAVADLGRQSRAEDLLKAIEAADDMPAAQRLGYLLERSGRASLARAIRRWMERRPCRCTRLDPGMPPTGPRDETWMLLVNTNIEDVTA